VRQSVKIVALPLALAPRPSRGTKGKEETMRTFRERWATDSAVWPPEGCSGVLDTVGIVPRPPLVQLRCIHWMASLLMCRDRQDAVPPYLDEMRSD
jgi:hypothetical protein